MEQSAQARAMQLERRMMEQLERLHAAGRNAEDSISEVGRASSVAESSLPAHRIDARRIIRPLEDSPLLQRFVAASRLDGQPTFGGASSAESPSPLAARFSGTISTSAGNTAERCSHCGRSYHIPSFVSLLFAFQKSAAMLS